ncbi:MAG: hypothetical protein RL516_401 [Bacteroidota bacterium]|jgi:tetratricopeptide (TPR) repeat protein
MTKNKFHLILIIIFLTTSCRNKAQEHFKEGNSKFNKHNYSGALLEYTNAIELDSNFIEAIYWRGKANYELKNYNDAIIDYNKACNLNNNYKDAIYDRGCAKFESKDYKGAIEDFSKSISLSSKDTYSFHIYVMLTLSKININDYRGAIEECSNLIKKYPRDPLGYRLIGIAKINLGDKFGGCCDFKKAIELGDSKTDEISQLIHNTEATLTKNQ